MLAASINNDASVRLRTNIAFGFDEMGCDYVFIYAPLLLI
jgi:hypothetical protein